MNHSAVICAYKTDVSNQCLLFAEKHTKVPAVLQTMWTTLKHSIQRPKTKVCPVVPEQVHPDTSSVKRTDSESPDFTSLIHAHFILMFVVLVVVLTSLLLLVPAVFSHN